jgi:hypothetical protein
MLLNFYLFTSRALYRGRTAAASTQNPTRAPGIQIVAQADAKRHVSRSLAVQSMIGVSLTNEELVRLSDFYARRSDELRIAADESAARYSRYTQFLIVLGLLAGVAFYQSVFAKRWPLSAAILVIPSGALVVQQRHRCHLRSVQLFSLIEYYDKGAARLARKWDLLDGGDRFIDQDHFYSKDLDLFGQGSLSQILCSARTHIARETLAHWMKAPAKVEEIHARHEAISELRPRRELPELLATAGPMQVSDFRSEFFKA